MTTDLTVRALRALLFEVEDQSLTVNELRHLLWSVADQDADARTGIIEANREERERLLHTRRRAA